MNRQNAEYFRLPSAALAINQRYRQITRLPGSGPRITGPVLHESWTWQQTTAPLASDRDQTKPTPGSAPPKPGPKVHFRCGPWLLGDSTNQRASCLLATLPWASRRCDHRTSYCRYRDPGQVLPVAARLASPRANCLSHLAGLRYMRIHLEAMGTGVGRGWRRRVESWAGMSGRHGLDEITGVGQSVWKEKEKERCARWDI